MRGAKPQRSQRRTDEPPPSTGSCGDCYDPHMRKLPGWSLTVGLAAGLLLAGCALPESTATPTSSPEPAPSPMITPNNQVAPAVEEYGSPGALLRLPSLGTIDDQGVASFGWVQVEGPTVVLSDPNAEAPGFVAQQPGTYKFELVVTDNAITESRSQTATFVVGNDSPEIRVVSPGTGMVGGQISVQFTLLDSSADLASLQLEFSVDGGGTFQPATLVDRAPASLIGRQSDTTSSVAGEGVPHTFVWNATQDLGIKSAVDVFIRVTPVDSEVGGASGPFTYHPLLDGVAEACGLSSGEWELTGTAWEALSGSLSQCQNDLLITFDGEMDILRPVFSEPSKVEADSTPRDLDLSPLVEASQTLQQAATAAEPEAIAQRQARVEAEIAAWEDRLSTVGDDAQLANIDLQNALQKQQQSLQTISNVSKMLHDTAMAVIRKIG